MNKLHISLSYTRVTGLGTLTIYDLTDGRIVGVASRNFNTHPHTTEYHGVQPTALGLEPLNDPSFPLYDPFYQWALWHIVRVQMEGDELLSESVPHQSAIEWVATQNIAFGEISLGMLLTYAELIRPLYRADPHQPFMATHTACQGKPRRPN